MKNLSLMLVLAFFSLTAAAQKSNDGCGTDGGNDRNPLIVAVYNFVPDAAAKSANLRELLKSSSAFTQTLEADQSLRVLDNREQVMPAELGLELPEITGALDPLPITSGASYYFTGKIAKTNTGFLLTVELKNAKDNALVNEQKAPFTSESQAAATGATAASAMQKILAALAPARRGKRDAGDNVAISPRLDIVLDREKVKPNEIAKVKINLIDCDGKPLGNRMVNVDVQTDFKPPVSLANDLKTDALGVINDSVGASRPTVLRYTAVYKYKDLNGNDQTVGALQPLIVGSTKGYWLLYVEFYYRLNSYRKELDLPTPWNAYGREVNMVSGSLNIIMKAETNESETIGLAEDVVSFDGFVYRTISGDTTRDSSGITVRQSYQSLNTEQSGIEAFASAFSVNPGEKTFSANIASLALKGSKRQEQVNCFSHVAPCNLGQFRFSGIDESNIALELGGIGCEAEITQAMMSSGVFKCSYKKSEDLTDKTPTSSSLGTRSLEVKVALRSLDDTYLTIKKK